MRLLLDTQAFLWWHADHPRLGAEARGAIAHAERVWVSAASAWEIAIKVSLGKLRLPGPIEPAVEQSEFEKLPISFAHAERLAALPHHHRDPFDRMLIAQAEVERLTIVTGDPQFTAYRVPLIAT